MANTRTMTYSDSDTLDVLDALEVVRASKAKKTVIPINEFNNTINKMLHELQNTTLKDFDTKKGELIDYALHNYYKVDKKTVAFEQFMSNLRLYISKLKKQAPKRTLEERKEEAVKRLRVLLNKLENAQNEYEFGITENQICNIVDSFKNPEKSEKIRTQLQEFRKDWEHKRFKDTEEQWREISGLEGEYAVSSKGRIKNLKTDRILAGKYNWNGYRRISLKGKYYSVHRLVALAFIPNPYNLPQVNHIDEDKTNNDVSNLEWCSASENIRHSAHQQSCEIKQLTKDGEFVKVWGSSKQIERKTGYNQSNIINCCKGKIRSAYGYRWEYVDPSQQRKFNHPVIVHKDGEYVGTFANAVKASEALDLKYGSVYKCLNWRRLSNKGYTFTYAD